MGLLIGVDLGTTGCKATVYDDGGAALGESYLEYGLIALSATMIEQDPQAWWELTVRAIGLALEAAHADRSAVAGLAVSSQGISFVLVDAAGRPLGNAINWLDGRATEECAAILERYGADELFRRTGKRAAPFYVLPKLLWIRRHRPEVWRRARRLLMGHDYLVYRLCGEQVTDHSLAGGTLLYDLAGQGWSQELLDAFAIPCELLPAVRWAGAPAGTLRRAVAEELGLRADVIVAVGGQDQKCAALGAGIGERTATVSLGTASAIVQLMDRPATDGQMRIPTFPFVRPARWVLEGVVATAAGSLRWHRDTLAPGASYAALDAEAAAAPAGSEGVLFFPHLGGASSPHWQSRARGAFHGLSLATTRGHLTRAVLEGVAYQIRENLEITEEVAGPAGEVMLYGGGAKSALWRQIIADVLGRPIAWAETSETAGLGAAMLAGVGCGAFASSEAAADAMRPAIRRQWPGDRAAAYAGLYAAYRRIEAVLLRDLG
ncbi:MAG: xylulokinase [Anaerolineae bacterium]